MQNFRTYQLAVELYQACEQVKCAQADKLGAYLHKLIVNTH